MTRAHFRLELAGGAALKHYERRTGNLDALLPPATGEGNALAQRAASLWLGHAYNEHHSATLMAGLVQELTQAQAPLDLSAMACAFPAQELVHADLCGRLALALSQRPVLRSPAKTLLKLPAELTPRQRADEAVLRLCCVGESVSFAWLRAMRRRATEPGPLAVVKRLLRDEALHARFGWLYLEWALQDVSQRERQRLSAAAQDAIGAYAELLDDERKKSAEPELARFGLLDWSAQAEVTRAAIENDVQPELTRLGID